MSVSSFSPDPNRYRLDVTDHEEEQIPTNVTLGEGWFNKVVKMSKLNSSESEITEVAKQWLQQVPGWSLSNDQTDRDLKRLLDSRSSDRRVQFLAKDPTTGKPGKAGFLGRSEKAYSERRLTETKVDGVTTLIFKGDSSEKRATAGVGLELDLKKGELTSDTPYLDAIAVISQAAESIALQGPPPGMNAEQLMTFALNAAQLQLRAAQSFGRKKNHAGVIDRVSQVAQGAASGNFTLVSRAEKINRAYTDQGEVLDQHIDSIASQLALCLIGSTGYRTALAESVAQEPGEGSSSRVRGRNPMAELAFEAARVVRAKKPAVDLPELNPEGAPEFAPMRKGMMIQGSADVSGGSAIDSATNVVAELKKTRVIQQTRKNLEQDLPSYISDNANAKAIAIAEIALLDAFKERRSGPIEQDLDVVNEMIQETESQIENSRGDLEETALLRDRLRILTKIKKGMTSRIERGSPEVPPQKGYEQFLRRLEKAARTGLSLKEGQAEALRYLRDCFIASPRNVSAEAVIQQVAREYLVTVRETHEKISALKNTIADLEQQQEVGSPENHTLELLKIELSNLESKKDSLGEQIALIENLGKMNNYRMETVNVEGSSDAS